MVDYTVYKPVEEIKKVYEGGTITPPKYMPNFFEFLYFVGSPVVSHVNISNTYSSLATIPKNYTLFVTHLNLSYKTNAVGANGDVHISKNGVKILAMTAPSTDQDVKSVAVSFPFPLKITPDDLFRAESGAANLFIWACMSGFIVRNTDIPSL